MAYDDYLNRDMFKGGVMDAPDQTVRIAQAKIAAGAAHLLTSKEWQRIAQRQSLEQQSYKLASTPTLSEQTTAQRMAMNRGLPRFTAQELMEANRPGAIPAQSVIRNIPGRGESTTVGGVDVMGGPSTQTPLPVPEEGYGYAGGPGSYTSTTPYGMERGPEPVLGDTLATAPEQTALVAPVASAPAPRTLEQLLPSLASVPKTRPSFANVLGLSAYTGLTAALSPSTFLNAPQKMSPETVASNLLGTKPPAPVQQPEPSGGMTVSAVIPEGTTGMTELEPQGMGQEMVAPAMAAPQYAQTPVYTPPQLQLKPFNARQMMSQPSVSETLGMGAAVKQYQAETKAQIDAYKANVAAQRNAIRDSLDAQLKGQQLRKGELDIASRQIENQFASGGPQYGTFNIGDKTFGFIRTGPGSIQKIDLKPNQSSAELNYEFRVKANSEIAKRIKQGDEESAAIMYQSLVGKPEDFALFKRSFETVEPKAPADRGTTTAKASAAQRIRNPKTGEVRELRNGQWVKVQ